MGWCGPATGDNQDYKVGQGETKYAGIGPFGCDATAHTVWYPISRGTLANFQCRWSDSPGNDNTIHASILLAILARLSQGPSAAGAGAGDVAGRRAEGSTG
jgi:hypothetical protein